MKMNCEKYANGRYPDGGLKVSSFDLIDLFFTPVRTRNKTRSIPGWGFYSTKFYTGRFGPEVQPLHHC